MAATERVVVLMTPAQKQAVVEHARAENLSVGDYMRRRALGEDELLVRSLAELSVSTQIAVAALDGSIARLRQVETSQDRADRRARESALAEFEDVDPELFASLVVARDEEASRSGRKSR
jgi:hypothetical protein